MAEKTKASKDRSKEKAIRSERIKKLTPEENIERVAMTDYVVELLEYKAMGIKAPDILFKRIEGLRHGVYIPKGQKTGICYPYPIIKYTFMAMAGAIKQALRTVEFKDDYHRINYILVIIEKNVNDIYMSVEKNKKAKQKTEEKVIHIDEDVPNRYINLGQPETKELFDEDIW